MAPSRASHRIVCIGVSDVPSVTFPEKNARDLFCLFNGPLGPPSIEATCLLGAEASHAAVDGILKAVADAPPKFVMIYFSGVATTRGLKLADRVLPGRRLGEQLARMQGAGVVLVLDLLTTLPKDGVAQLPAWIDELAAELPHVRIAAARATAVGAGAEGHGHSRFTEAYLQALRASPGDLRRKGTLFVSDRRAFDSASMILRRRWGEGELPVEAGLFGGLPLLRSEAEAAVGNGQIVDLSAGPGSSLQVRFALHGRRSVPTVLHYFLVDTADEPLAEGSIEIAPDTDRHLGRTRFRVDPRLLPSRRRRGGLRFRVELRDGFGHVLDRQKVAVQSAG